jgi:hypothetical protein
VSGKDSDLLYFSVVALMAVFAIPAIAGPCLTLGECPVPVASDCHDEEGEGTDSCWCGVEAVPDATRETLKHTDSVWLVESTQMLGAAGNDISALQAALMPPSPPTRGEPLFVFNSSFLI